jgi:hypothetical protein
MGHPQLINTTPFAFDVLFLSDERSAPLCVPLVKATFSILEGGNLCVAGKQLPVSPSGEPRGDPAVASYKYEPETAFFKPATDVVMIGHAWAPQSRAAETMVGIRVGPVQKLLKVVGDRIMYRRGGLLTTTLPKPFEKLPLVYERAFGGWDKRDPDASRHSFEPRNPVGVGYVAKPLGSGDQLSLPNIEDPAHPFVNAGDTPPPGGVGFISPNWQPRASFAGTYDEKWDNERKPLLPTDFDRRFFNAATPGLVAPGFLKGDEPVVIVGAAPEGRVAFTLPGIPAPSCTINLSPGKRITLQTNLDTVIVNMDDRLLILMWRAHVVLPNGPHDLASATVDTLVPVVVDG